MRRAFRRAFALHRAEDCTLSCGALHERAHEPGSAQAWPVFSSQVQVRSMPSATVTRGS